MSDAGDALSRSAYDARRQQRTADAARLYLEAAAAYQAEGNVLRTAHAIRHAGDAYFEEGRLEFAEPCFAEALDLYRCHGNPPSLDLANAIRSMALLREATGATAEAATLWREAGDLYKIANLVEGVAESTSRAARLAAGQPASQRAAGDPSILDPLFREAVAAIDTGRGETLERLLADHPRLLRDRLDYGEGYFREPYLLWFIAENPIRTGRLPRNIAEIARTIVGAARHERVDTLDEQLAYALSLVSSGRIPRECGVQLELIDTLVDEGARPERALLVALAHRERDAAERLIEHGAPVTLLAAACLRPARDVTRLARTASADERHLALAGAALHGRAAAIAVLVACGADVNAFCPEEFHPHATPLHHAVDSGALDAVKTLVDAGAKLESRDRLHDGTPLEWAVHLGRHEIASFLRAASQR